MSQTRTVSCPWLSMMVWSPTDNRCRSTRTEQQSVPSKQAAPPSSRQLQTPIVSIERCGGGVVGIAPAARPQAGSSHCTPA
eukprot:8479-Rhodomonas_salina.2